MQVEPMEYTGERMVPESADAATFWEHIYRYRFACKATQGKNALDIACGEGYGTAALLRSGANKVIGMDVDPAACEHARRRYGIDARPGSAEEIPLPSRSLDLVVSFETIEHLHKPLAFLNECVRVLKEGGTLIISTPNVTAYGQATQNPFHVRELTKEEFSVELRKRFSTVELFGQRPARVRWWSVASLSCEGSGWNRIRGLRELPKAARNICCAEIVRPRDLEKARLDPLGTILAAKGPLNSICNPYSISKLPAGQTFDPAYLLAVASSPAQQ